VQGSRLGARLPRFGLMRPSGHDVVGARTCALLLLACSMNRGLLIHDGQTRCRPVSSSHFRRGTMSGTAVWMRCLWTGLASLAAMCVACVPAIAADIAVGQVAPLTGVDANQGRAYSAGMQLGFDAANRQAGIHSFRLVRADDQADPQLTVPLARKLVATNRPLVLAGFFGNRNIAELERSGLLETEGLALVGYRGVDYLPASKRIFNVRANLADELVSITQHLSTVGVTRLGLLFEDDEGAKSTVDAAELAAKQFGVQYALRLARSSRASSSELAHQMIDASPQAVIVLVNSAAAASFIEQFRLNGGTAQIVADSSVELTQLVRRLGEDQMTGIAIAQVVPSPYGVTNRITKEFFDLAAGAKGNPDAAPSFAMMEGYIAARVIVDAARKAGAAPTRQSFIAALETLDVDLGGYRVNYRTNRASGSHYVELSIINQAGRIVQ